MAFTLGRPPLIHQYEIGTKKPNLPKDFPVAPEYLYTGVIEFSIIIGKMYMQLFSATGQLTPREIPIRKLEPLRHSLRAPIQTCTGASPLKCSFECVQDARRALTMIVRAHEAFGGQKIERWTRFLNFLFSTIPFTAFVVLAGSTVATSSNGDLALLAATMSAIEPLAESEPLGKKLVGICKVFYQFASAAVTRQSMTSDAVYQGPSSGPTFGESGVVGQDQIMSPTYSNTSMDDIEFGQGFDNLALFTEPYMPFNWRI
ncbi:hypothetical protein FOVG_19710 [Fusarium oxysporum f. sp. pisi HDV247]|uniref:Uncharacterized protein n=1 Tax=Fusarium oxysporum f. sp. pisi HDV247 TaxID=1080344 RepID=W9N7I5_FUSOX|nr:hypothetical protein FOVG_19710 [Fusarium oxysporum f. sp. pisi HDV247]